MPLNFIVVPARIMPERANPASASGHCSRPLFSLSHRAYTFGTVHSSTPTTEELLNRAKDLIRQNREYLEHFNAVIDQLHKREEEFQAEHLPWGTRYS